MLFVKNSEARKIKKLIPAGITYAVQRLNLILRIIERPLGITPPIA
jgi:hypothetical protein